MQIQQIKSYLKKNKITYIELSEKSGIPLGTLKNIFSKCNTNPRNDTMQAIQEALGLNSPAFDWTEDDKLEGVGKHPEYYSEEEKEWMDLRSEIIDKLGKEYLRTLITMIKAAVNEKK